MLQQSALKKSRAQGDKKITSIWTVKLPRYVTRQRVSDLGG